MIKAKTQLEAVKLHLLKYRQLTSMEAISNYGITRLSHCIYVLRREGMDIKTKSVTKLNRFGQTSTFANYKLN